MSHSLKILANSYARGHITLDSTNLLVDNICKNLEPNPAKFFSPHNRANFENVCKNKTALK